MKKILFVMIVSVLIPFFSFAQTSTDPTGTEPTDAEINRIKSAMDGMIQGHKYKLGVFRILPRLEANTGYDSNALYLEQEPLGDYYVSVRPAAEVAVKLGQKAYFELIEQLSLVWYKEFDQRRDIYTDTRGRFVTGSRRMLVIVDGGYVRRKDRYNEELDIPIEQELTDAGIIVDYTVNNRIGITNSFRFLDSDLKANEEVVELTFDPVDRRTYSYHGGMTYALKDYLHLTSDLNIGESTALDTDRTTRFWSVLEGISYARRRLHLHGRVGYGQSKIVDDPDPDPESGSRKHLLFSANADYELRKRLIVGAFVIRQFEFTALSDDVTLVTSAGGRFYISVPITDRWSLNAGYLAGIRFRDDELVIDGQDVDQEFFQTASAGASYRIYRNLSAVAAIVYQDRDSDLTGFNNDRVLYSFGVSYSTTF